METAYNDIKEDGKVPEMRNPAVPFSPEDFIGENNDWNDAAETIGDMIIDEGIKYLQEAK